MMKLSESISEIHLVNLLINKVDKIEKGSLNELVLFAHK